MEFLDVPGASGAHYRFRSATLDALPPTAGNLVAVSGSAPNRTFLYCGAARSLNRARADLEALVRDNPAAGLFIRLNVARTTREAEHADIVAAVRPEADRPDID